MHDCAFVREERLDGRLRAHSRVVEVLHGQFGIALGYFVEQGQQRVLFRAVHQRFFQAVLGEKGVFLLNAVAAEQFAEHDQINWHGKIIRHVFIIEQGPQFCETSPGNGGGTHGAGVVACQKDKVFHRGSVRQFEKSVEGVNFAVEQGAFHPLVGSGNQGL